MRSAPGPPRTTSSPPNELITSSPGPPKATSAPPTPWPGSVTIRSAPARPRIRSAPRPLHDAVGADAAEEPVAVVRSHDPGPVRVEPVSSLPGRQSRRGVDHDAARSGLPREAVEEDLVGRTTVAPGSHPVVAGPAGQPVADPLGGTFVGDVEPVGAPEQQVVAPVTRQAVLPRAPADPVRAASAVQGVVAAEAGDHVSAGRAVQHIVPGRPDDGGHPSATRHGRRGHRRDSARGGAPSGRQHDPQHHPHSTDAHRASPLPRRSGDRSH